MRNQSGLYRFAFPLSRRQPPMTPAERRDLLKGENDGPPMPRGTLCVFRPLRDHLKLWSPLHDRFNAARSRR